MKYSLSIMMINNLIYNELNGKMNKNSEKLSVKVCHIGVVKGLSILMWQGTLVYRPTENSLLSKNSPSRLSKFDNLIIQLNTYYLQNIYLTYLFW